MNYGNTFAAWREQSRDTWSAYTQHAFVQSLGDGTLSRECFLHYLVQDYVFLIHFSRAWALAVTKADTVEEMRLAAGTVNGLINEEIGLHVRICAEAGISEEKLYNAEERAENLAYTRYVLDAGHSGDLLDLLSALAPCVMGYGEIGSHLKTTATSEVYKDWIDTYSGSEYQDLCVNVGRLIDAAMLRRIGETPQESPRWPSLQKRFDTACRLEAGFWDMGLSP